MGEIIDLKPDLDPTAEIDPQKILQAAIDSNLTQAIVVGTTQDGNLYLSFSTSYIPDIIWLLMSAQKMLMDD